MADKNKKGKNTIVIVLFLLLIVGGGTFAGTYYFMSKNNASEPIVIEEAFFEVGEIFVNLSDEGAKRYVKLNITVSYDKKNTELAAEIEEKSVVLRDISIFYIKSCKAKDFEPTNEAVLKGELINRINKKLINGQLKDVYISDIIVQ